MVATELAVFLLGEGAGGTGVSTLVELLESHEKGLLNFRPVGAGAAVEGGFGEGGAAGGLFDRVSQGMLMLLKDIVLAV